ncbi:MAG: glycosyltransferase family 4 protein [Deltaproteobacteria bacterium]|nr:glycosyltransferase family 4 protein [Deltaproteobacteria bacterium]
MDNLKIIIAAFVGSAILTGLIRDYAIRRAMVDVPNERSSHTSPTPRGGGLAIVATFIAVLSLLFIRDLLSPSFFLAMSLGSLSVAVIGFWDDHGHVPPCWRILVHFAAAGWALYCLGGISSLLPKDVSADIGWLGAAGGAVLIVWMLNLYNFMDGIDGIAAVEAICVAGGAAVIMWLHGDSSQLLLLLGLAAGCMGFLVWNWPPAKIFMGDVGSGFLGFVLSLFALSDYGGTGMNIWSWLILSGIFVVDATITLGRRIWRGERFYLAHRSHAYQILSRRLGSHAKVTLGTFIINIVWLMPFAFLAATYDEYAIGFLVISLLPIVWGAVRIGAGTAS